jgi:FixJ family two-component response regulator
MERRENRPDSMQGLIGGSMSEHLPGHLIAVVDDDPGILRSLAYLLESADYRVRTFASGAKLLDAGTLEEFDCLISDIDMPGMEGFELLRLVRMIRPRLPVILITGDPDALQRLHDPGAEVPPFFAKPFQGPQLLAAVSDALKSSRSTRS